jgi:hypothetical protein
MRNTKGDKMRICIVGNGCTRDKAPFDDLTAEIWTTASVAQNIPRVTRIFEIHDGVYPADKLNSYGCPIMMKEVDPEVQASERFPIEALYEMFGHIFNGSIEMILAFSWIMGYDCIELYGIDFSSEAEINRRMMFMYCKGKIEGMGGRVLISPGSHLIDVCETYQYDTNGHIYLDDMVNRVSTNLQEDIQAASMLEKRIDGYRGALQVANEIKRRNLW